MLFCWEDFPLGFLVSSSVNFSDSSDFARLFSTAVPRFVSLDTETVLRLAGKSKLAVPNVFAALAFAISNSSIRSFSLRRKGDGLRDLVRDRPLQLLRSSE